MRSISILLLSLFVIIAASCGGSDKKETGATGASGDASAAEQKEAEVVSGAAPETSSEEKDKESAEAEAEKVAAANAAAEKAEAVRVAALNVPPPSFRTKSDVFAAAVTISIQPPSLKEAIVVYTVNGADPSPSKGTRYAGPFSVSSSALVKAVAYVPGGKRSAVVSADYTIGEVCAAPGAKGTGRRGAPLGSVGAAIEKARSLGIGTVKLAAGTFEESIELSAPIIISGGFKANFTGPAGKRTVVRGKASDMSSKKAPAFAIKISGKAADSTTKIERVEFRGPEASYGAGVLVAEGATPEFSDCASFGGAGSYGYGVVSAASASPSFKNCRLDGGGGATSYGLSVDGASATVDSSLLLAGTGTVGGYGFAAVDAKVTVTASVLAGGAANVGYGAALYNSKGSRLDRCTIVGGTGKDVSGVFISTSNPSIEKCVIAAYGAGKSYGITANYGESAPSLLSGTVFIGCAGGAYYDAQTKTAYKAFNASGRLSSADGKTPAKPQGEGNSVGIFELGAAPLYPTPSSASVAAGAPALTFQ